MQLDMLVRKRRGFTRRLVSHSDKEYTGWISRPFGQPEAFGDYGSVLMFATDIGIAAHLPYLKIFMQGRTEASIRTRRVVVVWQVKDRNHDKWAQKWFDKLLPSDTSFTLEIRIHRPCNDPYESAAGVSTGEHGLTKLIAVPADFEQILEEEIARERRERVLVSVCVDDNSRTALKRAVANRMDAEVNYHEHEFQAPDRTKRSLILE